jgi:hypothetical protein
MPKQNPDRTYECEGEVMPKDKDKDYQKPERQSGGGRPGEERRDRDREFDPSRQNPQNPQRQMPGQGQPRENPRRDEPREPERPQQPGRSDQPKY